MGVSLTQAGLWPLAIHALQQAKMLIEAKTEVHAEQHATILAFLGHALAQAGQPALDLFEQARQVDPQSALPLYFYGIYLRQQNALNAAENSFKEAATLDPNNAAILSELALTKIEQGKLAEAETLYNQAVAVSENSPEMRLLQVAFYGRHGYRVAEAGIPAAAALLEADEKNAQVHDWLGWMYFQSGEPGKAEKAYRRALELNANLVSARYHLARLLQAQRQLTEATAEYQRVVDWDTSGIYRDRALTALVELKK